ncbi:MAG: oxygen-independent coproporphyrinogen III oxidase [Bacteroidota bacterium]
MKETRISSRQGILDEEMLNLLRKYDKPGPRYTSYPTAPIFKPEFGAEQFTTAIDETNRENSAPLSLYFHLPFCETLCYYCGCTMLVSNNRDKISEYTRILKQEIDLLSVIISPSRQVEQVHWGGGTPTQHTPSEITDLAAYINKKFRIHPDAEISVEVDPRRLSNDHLLALRDGGFNRVSLGIQDFDDKVQEAVNRIQPEQVTKQVIDWCKSIGFSSINMDLIYGLPRQTVKSFERTVDEVIKISPDRIAVYSFAYVPWMKPHQKLISDSDLPTPREKLSILAMATNKFIEAGYVYIGMDHFAKANDSLTLAQKTKRMQRNFQGYSTKADMDLFGLGMSSISHFGNYYAQNAKIPNDYYKSILSGKFATRVGYSMTKDDVLRKHVIMRLMCDLSLSKRTVEKKFNVSFDDYFGESIGKLQPLIEDGLVENTYDSIIITQNGRFFIRNIAMCFDAYLPSMVKEKPIFSRTV